MSTISKKIFWQETHKINLPLFTLTVKIIFKVESLTIAKIQYLLRNKQNQNFKKKKRKKKHFKKK